MKFKTTIEYMKDSFDSEKEWLLIIVQDLHENYHVSSELNDKIVEDGVKSVIDHIKFCEKFIEQKLIEDEREKNKAINGSNTNARRDSRHTAQL